MKLDELKTIEQISQFIDGTQKVIFKTKGCKREKYHWITSQLVKFKYSRLNKKDKGTVITYLRKVTAYSKSQTTRLIYKRTRTRIILLVPTRSKDGTPSTNHKISTAYISATKLSDDN